MAALLVRCGLPAKDARCLALLLRGAGVSRAEAASATGLAPQDVSDAMRALENRGVARVESAARQGPGRPQLRYHLAGAAPDVLRQLAGARRKALEAELVALAELERAA